MACPTIGQCTAVGGNGYEVTFDPATPGTPTPAAIDVANGTFGDVVVTEPTAVACPSASQCTAVDGSGNEVTFNPTDGDLITGVTVLVATAPYVGNGMNGVACPSTTQCTAVDYEGHQATFDPASPGSAIVTEIAAQRLTNPSLAFPFTDPDPTGVACPSTSQCTAVDGFGQQVTFDPASAGATHTTIDRQNILSAIACSSPAQCVAVDQLGRVLVGAANSATASIAAFKLNGAKLTAELSCAGSPSQSCTGTLALSTLEHLRSGKLTALSASHKTKKQSRTVLLASASYVIAAGTSQTLTITLNATGRQLLAKYHRLPAELTLTPPGTKSAVASRTIKITPGKARSR